MVTNDLKKGTRIQLRGTGWYATLLDNMKGNTRVADVEGFERESGSVYSHDIVRALVEVPAPGQIAGTVKEWVEVEHTPKQKTLRKQVNDFSGE